MQPQTLFTNYIIAGVTAVLARVRAAAYVVPEADRQQAWHLLSFGLKLDDAWPVTSELLLALAPKMELAGFREEWIPYLEKGLHCAQKVGDGLVAAECELQIGLLYRLLSRYNEAQQWTMSSFNHFVSQKNTQGQARTLNELAWLEQLQHHYVDATQYVEEALSRLTADDPERAMSYRVQGMIAIGKGQLQEAETYHHKALVIFEQKHDKRRNAWSLHNLAYAIHGQSRLEQAICHYERASTILEEIGDKGYRAIVQLNLGRAQLDYGKPKAALKYLVEAEAIFHQSSDQLQLARITTNIGLAYLALEDYPKATKAFQRSMNFYKILGETHLFLNAMDGLAMVLLANKRYEKAIKILNKALKVLPTITDAPNYDYLQQTLSKHLQQAKQEQYGVS